MPASIVPPRLISGRVTGTAEALAPSSDPQNINVGTLITVDGSGRAAQLCAPNSTATAPLYGISMVNAAGYAATQRISYQPISGDSLLAMVISNGTAQSFVWSDALLGQTFGIRHANPSNSKNLFFVDTAVTSGTETYVVVVGVDRSTLGDTYPVAYVKLANTARTVFP